MAGRSLNAGQMLFAQEYMKDFNGTQAAVRAGYSPKTAHVQACNLLKHPKVAAEIKRLQTEVAERNELTVDQVIAEIRAVAFHSLADYVTLEHGVASLDLSKLPAEQLRALKKITQKELLVGSKEDGCVVQVTDVETHDKLRALDMLMRHLGAYAPEKHALTDLDGNEIDYRQRVNSQMARIAARLPAQDGAGGVLSESDPS